LRLWLPDPGFSRAGRLRRRIEAALLIAASVGFGLVAALAVACLVGWAAITLEAFR
jgi:hypothetical protein